MEGVLVTVFLSSFIAQASTTSCSLSNRVSNLQQCIREIKAAGSNDSAFWFGNQYATLCPQGNMDGAFACYQPSNASNLFSRMFKSAFVSSALDRFLTMEFTSPPGTYTGCGNTYTTNTTWKSDIDPLSGLIVKPWYVRFLPYLQWATLPGELFTFVMYDAGYLNTHAIYTNIQGNDFSLAEATLKYNGPGNPGPRENIYVCMIFRQAGHLTVPASWRNKMQQNVNFTELITDWHLTGPVAMNWLNVVGDEYAAQRAVNNHLLNTCPSFVEKELNTLKQRPFLPHPTHIDVGITVTYNSPAIDFNACCSKHTFSQESFEINPLGNPVYSTYKVSHKPDVTFLKRGFYPGATNFTGELYTLIMVDPDIPGSSIASEARPLIHWLVTNIRDGNMSTGEEYMGYGGPRPSDGNPHYYYFLLYKQSSTIPVSSIYSYTTHCAQLLGRCMFNINGFVSDKKLTLVGVNWIRSNTDIYVAFQNIYIFGGSASQWCTGMQGYKGSPSCSSGTSAVVHPDVIVG